MVTKYDYSKNEVEACLSVLVELMTVLGELGGAAFHLLSHYCC
jgi:hypothetical protein